ncbi:MAG TPA: N-acetylglucosamine-6-phosphate deacetylase [Ktedonobacterales bacterium]
MRMTLRGARLVDASTDLPAGEVVVEDGVLAVVGARRDRATGRGRDAQTSRHEVLVDATGAILTPGFIDVHTHGGGGYNLHTLDPDEILAYARWAPRTGLTGFLIAIVGVPDQPPDGQLRAAVAACAAATARANGGASGGAEPLGIFLEGPYISAARRGAHMASWLRLPDVEEINRLLEVCAGRLRLITLAPELPGAAPVIRRLVEAGVTVSIGHTDATYEQTLEAIQIGVTHATHCCNAMRPLGHRDPGPLAAIAQSPEVLGEVIADGVHVHPAMLALLTKLLGPDRTIIITDALAGAGTNGAAFEFAGQPAHVERGAARLSDGTITGSVLTVDQALRNAVRMTGASLREAVGMLTLNPARAIHLDGRKGRLRAGYDADLLLWDADLTLQATFCRGELAYCAEAWRGRLGGSDELDADAAE